MLLNYRIILFILFILLPLNVVAVQPAPAAKEVSAQQPEKPTLRKKIIKWATIATGIATAVAGAATIYFKTRSSKPEIKELSPAEYQKHLDEINSRGLVKHLSEIKNIGELNALREQLKTTKSWSDGIETSFMYFKGRLEKERNENLRVDTKPALLHAIKATTTEEGLEALKKRVHQTFRGLQENPWDDAEVNTATIAMEYLVRINSYRQWHRKGYMMELSIPEQVRGAITSDLRYLSPNQADHFYNKLKNVDDAEFQQILKSPETLAIFENQKKDWAAHNKVVEEWLNE